MDHTCFDPASSWFEIVELPVVEFSPTSQSKIKVKPHDKPKEAYFDKSSSMISTLVNRTWFSRYPCCQHIFYDNGSEFKLHFEALCDSYGIKHKPTSVNSLTAMWRQDAAFFNKLRAHVITPRIFGRC